MKHSRWLAATLVLSLVAMIPVPANACGSSCNNPPFASFDGYQSGPAQWSFDASDSRDIDGYIVSYFWSFGDGETQTTTSPYTSHYFGPGEYYVWLTVTDDDGACNSTWIFVKTCGGSGQPECFE